MSKTKNELYRALDGAEPEGERYSELLEQCRIWNERDEYQKIIDALEAIPDQARTPETDSELARAYNNLADPGEPRGIFMIRRALALLKPHEAYFEGDHVWNFRMGYSYYHLDQEGRGLFYFRRALEALPGDKDTEELIGCCEDRITLPRFRENFRERTQKTWAAFAEQEAELRRFMEEDRNHERGEELTGKCEQILNLAFEDISFEMGFNGRKPELILTPEGDKVKLFELVYFQKHAPAEVLEHWNILVGRQPAANMGLRSGEWEISGDDVRIRLEQTGEKSFALFAYCEKLLPLLPEEEGRAWWLLTTLTDQVLGEIPHMRYIDAFHVLHEPGEEPCILLTELPGKLQDMGLDLSSDPEAYLEGSYTGYRMEPNEDPNGDWRLDVIAGSTNCTALVSEYLNNENGYMDALHADGAAAGFFCYPLEGFTGENRSQQIFDFRDKLEAALREGSGGDCVTLTGGATGIYCGYVDFIAWDLLTVLTQARVFFENIHIPWADFHVFRRDAGTVALKARKE